MRRYDSYKDSGVEWLREIPSHWSLKKSKFLWKEIDDRSVHGDEELLSVSQYSGVLPRTDDSRSESLEDYKKCCPDDLVVNIMLAWLGGLGIANHSGIVSPAYCVYRQKENNNPAFLGYLYRTPLYLAEFARRSKGVVPSRWRMYTEDFGQVLTLLPPREEQNRIVTFLDEKTAEIDAAIAKKERLIELLKEQKNILINRAVTRGLNPDAPMRDSGVEWIGEIPAHWNICRAKHITSKITKGTTPSTEGKGFQENGIRYFKAENIIDNKISFMPEFFIDFATDKILSRSRLQPNDVLFVIAGATIGKTAIVYKEHVQSNTNQAVCILRPKKDILPEFLHAWLQSDYVCNLLKVNSVLSAQPNIAMEDLGNIWLPLPLVCEQNEITIHIKKIDTVFEAVGIRVEAEIKALSEYKTSLISAVVTGKIKAG